MALIVEDGTGKTDAESYCTEAFANAYFAARGDTLWSTEMSTDQREQALRRATDYMVQVYRSRWAGYRKTDEQALDWPRYEVPRNDSPSTYGYGTGYRVGYLQSYYADDIVPVEVQRACAFLALKAAAGELAPDLERVTQREKIDVIEVEYATGSVPYKRFRAADNMLMGMFKNGRGSTVLTSRT